MNRHEDTGLSFYVVDDDSVIIELVGSLLRGAGYAVKCNLSSKDALRDIIEQQPDCVLLDIMMPELDGLELCRKLRESQALVNTRIIVLSGKSYDFDRKRALHFQSEPGTVSRGLGDSGFDRRNLVSHQDRFRFRLG